MKRIRRVKTPPTPLKREDGATMVEYSLMVAFIALASFGAAAAFGGTLDRQFTTFMTLFP